MDNSGKYLKPPGPGSTSSASGYHASLPSGSESPPMRAESRTTMDSSRSLPDEGMNIRSKEPAKLAHHGKLCPPLSGLAPAQTMQYSPTSKTAIGRLVYSLKDLPELFLAEIKVLVQPVGVDPKISPTAFWDDVNNGRLKRKAITKFMKREDLNDIRSKLTVKIGARKNMDHIIALLKEVDGNLLERKLVQGPYTADRVYRFAKHTGNHKERHHRQKVACEIQGGIGLFEDRASTKLYRDSLNSVLRRLADPTIRHGDNLRAGVILDCPVTTNQSHKIDPFAGQQRPGMLEIGTGLRLGLRISPSVDLEYKAVLLDLDLVPFIHPGWFHKALFDIFGEQTFLDNVEGHLPVLNKMLDGLVVRCSYGPPTKEQILNGVEAVLSKEDSFHEGREFRITRVAMPDSDAVPPVEVGGVEYSVIQYFNNFLLPDGRKLQYPKLPLVSDNSKHWFPIEMLFIEYPQEIAHWKRGKLCSAAQDQVRMFLERIEDETIIQYMQPFFQKIGTMDAASGRRAIVANGNPQFFRNNLLDGPKSEHKGKKKTLDMKQASPVDFGIIDLATCAKSFTNKIINGARNGPYLTLQRGTCVSLQGTEALTRPGSNAELDKMLQYNPAIILAIIGDGHGKQQRYDALYNFADRQQGIPIVIAQKKHIEEGYDLAKVDDPDKPCLPDGLRRKLIMMLGEKNFVTSNTLKTTSKKDLSHLMVVGAHISTPKRHEVDGLFDPSIASIVAGDDGLFDPSIASIVASSDSSATKFLGSSRIQQSFSAMKPDNDKNVPESRILDLRAMMEERFKAWTKQTELQQAEPPTAMLFYRGATHADDTIAEVAAIKEAYRSVFKNAKETIQVTYITAIKNGLTTERPHFLIEPKNSAAYQYFIPVNEADFTPEELKEITISINNASQLAPRTENMAKALPLKYAAKLTRRVNAYYRTCVHPGSRPFPTENVGPMQRQKTMVAYVQGRLDGKVKREGFPWRAELDDKMFYL